MNRIGEQGNKSHFALEKPVFPPIDWDGHRMLSSGIVLNSIILSLSGSGDRSGYPHPRSREGAESSRSLWSVWTFQIGLGIIEGATGKPTGDGSQY